MKTRTSSNLITTLQCTTLTAVNALWSYYWGIIKSRLKGNGTRTIYIYSFWALEKQVNYKIHPMGWQHLRKNMCMTKLVWHRTRWNFFATKNKNAIQKKLSIFRMTCQFLEQPQIWCHPHLRTVSFQTSKLLRMEWPLWSRKAAWDKKRPQFQENIKRVSA